MPSLLRCPALIVSAPSSGQGKTMFTAALARYHQKQGRRVQLFKIGPDFLDPMILSKAIEQPVQQLDLWMMGEAHCRHLLFEAAENADLIIIEGVMGLFDGKPSTADFARLFKIPVVILIDVRGMGETCHAVGYGLTHFCPELHCLGIIANGIASTRHGDILLRGFHPEVDYLGGFPYMQECVLPDRHLGLVQAAEIDDFDARINTAADAIASAELGLMPGTVQFQDADAGQPPLLLENITIAIGRDSAFSFIYEDNLKLLKEMGARLLFFSILHDDHIPECDAIYLPGGYPELHLRTLSSNNNMKHSIRRHHQAKKPIYAECGGMMILFDNIIDTNGESESMTALLPGSISMQKTFVALGYQYFPFSQGELRGHTFHYSQLQTPLKPALQAKRKDNSESGEAMYVLDNLRASYVHCYFRSCLEAAASLFLPEPLLIS